MKEAELDSLLCELLHRSDDTLCVLDTSGIEFEIRNEEQLVRRILDDPIFDKLLAYRPSLRQPAA